MILGSIAGVHGVKGWVKLYSHTEPREAILDYEGLKMRQGDRWQDAGIEQGQRRNRVIVAKLAGVDDRDEAAKLIGNALGVSRRAMPDADKDQYYWADLQGLQVVHADGREIGQVDYLIATGANDVLVVQGEREVLIPFVPGKFIQDVDIAAGVIHVDWEWDFDDAD